MQYEHRPDPDALLQAIQHEEAKHNRGKLKIFFGMAAGVGKTYAMLEAARQRREEGIDVVIGYVETHGRAETAALVEGLPLIPRRKVTYRGSTLEDMDLDAVLARRPQLVLVDELAHTNAEGSRHPKRYQDVMELIVEGINVYTTVNVQHLESRTDTVAQITGVIIRETVPDTVIDLADEIELVDLEPDDLLKRLEEGKVYAPERAELASRNFFRKGNLTALREMALRLTAEHVDQQMQDYMHVKQIPGPWKSLDRLMVAVSPSPLSERLIRWTRRAAYTLKAPWMAVYVEPLKPLSEADKAQLSRNLSLVHKLGGELITTASDDAADEIMRIARVHNVTQIVVGKPARNWWLEVLRKSTVNRLIRISETIDIYVITGDDVENTPRPRLSRPEIHSNYNQYLLVVAVVFIATAISYIFEPLIGYRELSIIMLAGIVVLGNFVGRGPILLAAALTAVSMDFLFFPPRFSIMVTSLQDGLLLSLYIIIALVTGNLTTRLASQRNIIHQREDRMSALYRLSRQFAQAVTLDNVLQAVVEQVGSVFDSEVAILVPTASGRLSPSPYLESTLEVNEKEYSVAEWCFEHHQAAGRFTDTLPNAAAQYLPLMTPSGCAGVLAIKFRNAELLSIDQETLLQTFTSNISLAIERELLHNAAHREALVSESERLYSALLASVSKELRAPLASIDSAVHELLAPNNLGNGVIQVAQAGEIQKMNDHLHKLVNNLLMMTRLESGRLKLSLAPCDVRQLIVESLESVKMPLREHDVVLDVADDLPPATIDCALMRQVLVNLLLNAAKYSPKGGRVRIGAKQGDNELLLTVADRGPGMPTTELSRVFDKFYQISGTHADGLGLGLAVAKGIVEAHGGTISAENRSTNSGARFIVQLPMNGKTSGEMPLKQ